MPGAVARPRKGGSGPPDQEDAFIRALNRFIAWSRENTGVLLLAATLLAVVVGGGLYWRSYQQNLEERASAELATLQARLVEGTDTAVVESLQGFLEQFDGTKAAHEARILLSKQQLAQGQPAEAAEAIGPVAGAHAPDIPTGYAAHSLLAEARLAGGDTAEALSTLDELSRRARFPFQRREAAAERASLLAERGRLEEARDIYRRLAEEAADTEAGDLYALRLGELEARLRSTRGSPDGSQSDS